MVVQVSNKRPRTSNSSKEKTYNYLKTCLNCGGVGHVIKHCKEERKPDEELAKNRLAPAGKLNPLL